MATVNMRQLLEAGAHFGHRTRYWNPKMDAFIFGERNRIHIINLEQTLPLLKDACNYVGRLAANGGRILFVGTKRAARDAIETEAQRSGMPFVSQRWLGGTLTNFKTIKQSVKRMNDLEKMIEEGGKNRMTKKEAQNLDRELAKLRKSLGGIKEMPSLPDCVFIIDTGYEKNAVREARKLGIPIVAVVDTNNDPAGIDCVIPGNDDATRAIKVYCTAIADAVIEAKGANSVAPRAEEFVEADDKADAKSTARKPARSKKDGGKPEGRPSRGRPEGKDKEKE